MSKEFDALLEKLRSVPAVRNARAHSAVARTSSTTSSNS